MAETSDTGKVDSSNSGAPLPASIDSIGRRRLLRGAAGAAPVMLSLASRPVIAGGQCTDATSFGSANSRPIVKALTCSGKPCEYWSNGLNWPSPYVASSTQTYSFGRRGTPPSPTKFDDVFGDHGGYPGMSLLDVLKQGGSDRNELARYIVAALLNAKRRLTPPEVLNTAKVMAIWTSFAGQGYYEPTSGMKWYASDIVKWLKTTMA